MVLRLHNKKPYVSPHTKYPPLRHVGLTDWKPLTGEEKTIDDLVYEWQKFDRESQEKPFSAILTSGMADMAAAHATYLLEKAGFTSFEQYFNQS